MQSREYLKIIEREKRKEEIGIVLDERQRKAIEYVKAQGSISISEYISLNSVSDKTTRRDLTDLVAKGVFEKEGVTTGLEFKLTSVNFGWKQRKSEMNQQDFKQTEIGKIPKEWEVKKIIDLFDVETGTTPSTKQKEYWNGGHINWVTPADMSKLHGRLYVKNSERKITEKGLKEANLALMPGGSIIISTRAPVGYVAIIKGNATFNQGCKSLTPRNRNEINPEFYTYYLLSRRTTLEHSSGGSTFRELSKNALGNLKIPFPPLPEQKKIAEILSTVDETIERVDEAIAKTERLKRGLMQELLTKGIRHKEFKQTEIGRIPKKWKVVRLKEIADINKESQDPNREFPEKEFFYIDIDSIENETGVIRSCKRITGKDAPSRARRLIRYGDVIMSTVRPYLKAFAIVPREYNAQICSTGFAVLSCKERILASYLLYMLFSNSVIGQCNRMMVGAQYPALNNSQVEKIEISLPPLPEQEKIAEILNTADGRLQLLREKKERLGRVKKGLMNDLLTGKRRVKI